MKGRCGYTLIEILVALSVVAVLLAILLPAVGAMRESSRKASCLSRLGQLANGTTQYEAANGEFPPALLTHPNPIFPNTTVSGHRYFPAQPHVLPYIDQLALYNTINFKDAARDSTGAASGSRNHREPDLQVVMFQCPSDPQTGPGRASCSYRISLGVGPEYFNHEVDGKLRGAFVAGKNLRPADFRDGLSHTVGWSERRMGSWQEVGFDRTRDSWYTGVNQMGHVPSAAQLEQLCALAPANPGTDAYTWGGRYWMDPTFEHTWFNHQCPPNSPIPACSAGVITVNWPENPRTTDQPNAQAGLFGASSYHRGGVNAALMDGSARFFSSSMSADIWRALGTSDGGEAMDVE